jgi:hypothetical protein
LDTFLMGHPATLVLEEKGLLSGAAQLLGPLSMMANSTTAALETTRDRYFRALSSHVGSSADRLIIDKEPLNILLAPLLHALFGNSRVIFAQRHPCDVVLSAYMQSFRPNLGMASFLDLADAADFYDAAMCLWTASTEALPLEVQTVTYERLVRDPEEELRSATNFLGLDWLGQLLDHQSTARQRGTIMNTSYDQIAQPLQTSAVGRWLRYRHQLEPVLPLLLPWAERLGYAG